MMSHDITLLFTAPKRGGILQSSGFLDLRCLMALSRTCKAHAFDELSLIQLIENEVTRRSDRHRVQTMDDAISFWKDVYSKPLLRQWLERDGDSNRTVSSSSSSSPSPTTSIQTRHMMSAARYDVMLSKMLRTVPAVQQSLSSSCQQDGTTVNLQDFVRVDFLLHCAANAGNLDSIKIILAHCQESSQQKQQQQQQTLQTTDGVDMQVVWRRSALFRVAHSGNNEMVNYVLSLWPESDRLHAATVCDENGKTALHCAAGSGNLEAIKSILSLFPETQRLQAVSMQDSGGRTVLHYVASSDNLEALKFILNLWPESLRTQALNMEDTLGRTVLQLVQSEEAPFAEGLLLQTNE